MHYPKRQPSQTFHKVYLATPSLLVSLTFPEPATWWLARNSALCHCDSKWELWPAVGLPSVIKHGWTIPHGNRWFSHYNLHLVRGLSLARFTRPNGMSHIYSLLWSLSLPGPGTDPRYAEGSLRDALWRAVVWGRSARRFLHFLWPAFYQDVFFQVFSGIFNTFSIFQL
jgi:hypothetical protein